MFQKNGVGSKCDFGATPFFPAPKNGVGPKRDFLANPFFRGLTFSQNFHKSGSVDLKAKTGSGVHGCTE